MKCIIRTSIGRLLAVGWHVLLASSILWGVIFIGYFLITSSLALVVGGVCSWLGFWAGAVAEVSWKTSKSLIKRLVRPAAKPAVKTVSEAPAAHATRDHFTR